MTYHVVTAGPVVASRLVQILRRVFVCPFGHRFMFHRDVRDGLVLVCPRCLTTSPVILPKVLHHV